MDKATRYTWIFLTKTKIPPTEILKHLFHEHGNTSTTGKTIRTDKGGELWSSQAFRQTALNSNYLLKPTAAGAPFQNGIAERPNQTLGTMVRCLLHSANLGPEFWSYALVHAEYLKNRLPHTATNTTPYQAYTGVKPSTKYIRVFGCPVITKFPGKRAAKLDLHTSQGIFLGYTATDKNIYFMDTTTRRIKIATHCIFDEAGTTIPPSQQSLASKALQHLGMPVTQATTMPTLPEKESTPVKDTDNTVTKTQPHPATTQETLTDYTTPEGDTTLRVQLLSDKAQMPRRATDGAAGYDVYSTMEHNPFPQQQILIPLDISVQPPPGTYIQIHSRSGIVVKHKIEVKAGVIDSDYTGNLTVVLHNYGEQSFKINQGDRIAQLLILPHKTPPCMVTNQTQTTLRGNQGFGSTGVSKEIRTTINNNQQADTNNDDLPYDIFLSQDPFDHRLEIEIPVKGDHKTLGLQMHHCPDRNRLQLRDMAISIPAHRIP